MECWCIWRYKCWKIDFSQLRRIDLIVEKIRNDRPASEKRFDDQWYFQIQFYPTGNQIAPLVLWRILYHLCYIQNAPLALTPQREYPETKSFKVECWCIWGDKCWKIDYYQLRRSDLIVEKIRNDRPASEKRFDDQWYFQIQFYPTGNQIATLVLSRILYHVFNNQNAPLALVPEKENPRA